MHISPTPPELTRPTSTTLDTIADVGLRDADFSVCLVSIETEGLVQGSGPGAAKTSFVITRGSGLGLLAGIASQQISVGGISLTIHVQTGADQGKVRIYASLTSTQTESVRDNLSHRIKVTGRHCCLILV